MQNTNSSDNTCLEQAIEERLAARVENEKLSEENQYLKEEVQALKHRIAWFEKQIFGQKSEKRIIENPHQASLLTESTQTEAEEETSKETVNAYQRGKAKKERSDDCVTDSGLRFDPDVPVEIVEVMPPEGRGTCWFDTKSDQYLQTAQDQSTHLFNGCVAEDQSPPDESNRRTHAKTLERNVCE